jgi:hypothetical protein
MPGEGLTPVGRSPPDRLSRPDDVAWACKASRRELSDLVWLAMLVAFPAPSLVLPRLMG